VRSAERLTVIPANAGTSVLFAERLNVIPAQAGTSVIFAEYTFMPSPNITEALGGPGLRRDDGACYDSCRNLRTISAQVAGEEIGNFRPQIDLITGCVFIDGRKAVPKPF